MTIEEIKASGLLELFALGQLSVREHELVQEYLATYPSLKQDLQKIEQALETYAQAAAVRAPAAIRDRILNEIQGTSPQASIASKTSSKRSIWSLAALVAAALALILLYLLSQKDKEYKAVQQRLEIVIDSCSRENQVYLAQIETLRQLTREENEILHMVGTPKYPETDLYLHHNPVSRRNFIQVRDLPVLAANQSFQLWSLKPNTAPIPLTVFQQPTDQLIEVQYEDATASYAITIEPLGGQNSPTLENLIGIVNVGSE